MQTQVRTHMLDEIREQPTALRRVLASARPTAQRIATEMNRRRIRLIAIAARGTSDNAAVYAQYLFQYLNQLRVALVTPSLFTLYDSAPCLRDAVVIGISQSGQAQDVTEVLRQARNQGALTLAVTNAAESPLAREADEVLECDAGPEHSVAATKTYTTSCAALAVLASCLPGGGGLERALDRLPEWVAGVLRHEADIAARAERFVHAPECVVLGRAFQYCTARELALKLEETCYLIATPFSTADFRHGPAALVERGLPVVLIAAPGRCLPDAMSLLRWLRVRGADCAVISEDAGLLALATVPIRVPAANERPRPNRATFHEVIAPIVYIVAGQLFAQSLALERGLNPDTPRGLSKVTQTH